MLSLHRTGGLARIQKRYHKAQDSFPNNTTGQGSICNSELTIDSDSQQGNKPQTFLQVAVSQLSQREPETDPY
jgi:hypothetical protein